MSNIVPFASGQLPAYLQNRKAAASLLNKDVVTAAAYPSLSIKGKVFTLVKDGERKVMMKPDAPDETMQFIELNVIRANAKNRVFYAESYVEGESDNARPTCQSNDGITPSVHSEKPQAKKCAICPQAVWGTKLKDDGTPGEGTACSVNTRLAVTAPDDLKNMFLLRVPAGSRKNYADAVKLGDARGIPYNALVLKVGFDPLAPSPKLTFKPVGLLSDAAHAAVTELYEDDLTREIVGLGAEIVPPVQPGSVEADELDAAIAAKQVTDTAAKPAPGRVAPRAKAAPAASDASAQPATDISAMDEVPAPAKPAVKPAAAPAAVKPTAAPAASTGMDNLLGELEDLLGNTDD